MKSLGFVLSVVLISVSTLDFVQSEASKTLASPTVPNAVAQSDPQKSLYQVKTLGVKTLGATWEVPVTPSPPEPTADHKLSQFSLHVSSWGMRSCMRDRSPEDPTIRALCFIWIAIGRW